LGNLSTPKTVQKLRKALHAKAKAEAGYRAVAFSRTGDPATGDFSDAKVIKKFGDVPDDLSAL
jgi:hypothetical protein